MGYGVLRTSLHDKILSTLSVGSLLSSVPEMKLGWLEDVIAHRKMESAGH